VIVQQNDFVFHNTLIGFIRNACLAL
jgi:hypothetical protein